MSVLFFAAFLPRLAAINRYVTPDELIWVFRSVQFRQALLAGQWADTLTAGHPGVSTTWLGALAVSLQLWLRPSHITTYQWLTQLAWFAPENSAMFTQLVRFLTAGRVAVAIVNSLGVVAIFALCQRWLSRAAAILIATLLAFDPFLVGLSGLLHVDSLLATFATLSLLALALSISKTEKRPYTWAAISGIMAGFAILTKTPALLLPPFAALFFLLSMFTQTPLPLIMRIKKMVAQGMIWLGTCLLLVFALFPALWQSPLQVAQKMSSTSSRHIEEALRPSYFLGQTTFTHGPLFYPLTLSFRLSPIIFCGLILALFLIIRALWRRQEAKPWRQLPTWIFIVWPLLFLASITLAAKKFDRYALPVVPALIILASLGWLYLPALKSHLKQAIPLLVGIQAIFLLWAMPYPLTAVNPLLGGTAVARQVMELDWGEGIGAAAHWLAEQERAETHTAVAGIAPALAPFFPGHTLLWTAENEPQADYFITTVDGGHLQPEPPVPGAVPVHTVRFNGADRAVIFQAEPTAVTMSITPTIAPDRFAEIVYLNGTQAEATPTAVNITLQWQLVQPTNGRYIVKLDLLDEQGYSWASSEQPLLNEVYFYPEHWASGETPTLRYSLPLPPGLPPGRYTPAVSLFNEEGAQLPLLDAHGRLRGVTHYLPSLAIQPAPTTDPSRLTIPQPHDELWLNESLHLLGQEPLPETVLTGDKLDITLIWQVARPLGADLTLQFTTNGQELVRLPLSQSAYDEWQPGQIIRQRYRLPIPPEMVGGAYEVAVRPLLFAADSPATLGTVTIQEMQRDFAMPEPYRLPQPTRFGDGLILQGLALPQTEFNPGDTLPLTLYWSVEGEPSDLYTAFVHLIDPDGQLVAQADQWPGGLPTTLRIPGEIIQDDVTITLPPDLPAGDYTLKVGLYNAANGLRQPIIDQFPPADDRATLPVTITIRP